MLQPAQLIPPELVSLKPGEVVPQYAKFYYIYIYKN
jgi:hypothetical protein